MFYTVIVFSNMPFLHLCLTHLSKVQALKRIKDGSLVLNVYGATLCCNWQVSLSFILNFKHCNVNKCK